MINDGIATGFKPLAAAQTESAESKGHISSVCVSFSLPSRTHSCWKIAFKDGVELNGKISLTWVMSLW